MKWWDQMPRSSFFECWVLSPPLSPSSRVSLVLLCHKGDVICISAIINFIFINLKIKNLSTAKNKPTWYIYPISTSTLPPLWLPLSAVNVCVRKWRKLRAPWSAHPSRWPLCVSKKDHGQPSLSTQKPGAGNPRPSPRAALSIHSVQSKYLGKLTVHVRFYDKLWTNIA